MKESRLLVQTNRISQSNSSLCSERVLTENSRGMKNYII